jgi:DNA-binding transcriptional MerR regulator
MAKLPAVVESVEDVPEGFRDAYVEQDGKYVLDADVEAHPATQSLRNAAKARREEREQLAREMKQWRDLGLSPDEIAELKEKASQASKNEEKPDLDKLKAKWHEEWKKSVEPQISELERLRAENRTLRLDDKLVQDFLAAGGDPDSAKLMLLDTRERFDLDEKGRPIVKDDDGEPRPITPKDWFAKEYVKTRPNLFTGKMVAGSGAKESAGRVAGATKRSDLKTDAAKAAFITEHGLDAYKALPD